MKHDASGRGRALRTFIRKPLVTATAVATVLVCTSGTSSAQVLDEIIVTAQKREQSLQDVGISITSMTGQQMQALGVVDSFDIASFTPGVSLGGSQAGKNTQFTIRGVTQTDFNDVVEAPTAVYLDDGYIAVAQGQTFAVFDIARVEILKGPQGTLFGRNATGGLIHYISNKPSLEGPEGYVDVKLGRFDTPAHANDRQVQAAASTPLSDTVAVRAAINYNDQDAYLKNLYPYGTSSVVSAYSCNLQFDVLKSAPLDRCQAHDIQP